MDSLLTPPPLAINAAAGGSNRIDENTDPIPKLKKKSQGRRKIAIQKIENKNKKHVTFSKRRKGLFTKACELCILCGANVAIITLSEAGKVFSFGHPSPDAVIHRYLYGSPSPEPMHQNQGGDVDNEDDRRLGFWWDRSINDLGLEDLESFGALLKKLKSNVESKLMNLNHQQEADLKPVSLVPPLAWDEVGDHQFEDEYVQQQYGGGFTRRPDDQSIASIIPMPASDYGNISFDNTFLS